MLLNNQWNPYASSNNISLTVSNSHKETEQGERIELRKLATETESSWEHYPNKVCQKNSSTN